MVWAFIAIVSILLIFTLALIWLLARAPNDMEMTREIPHRPQREIQFTPVGHRPTPLGMPAISVGEMEEMPAIAKVLFSQTSETVNLCPACGRKFNPQIGLCPFDSTPLEPVPVTEVKSEGGHKQCPECDRSFEFPAKYCYVHGARLHTSTTAMRSFWACPDCGAEGAGEDGVCECGGTSRTAFNPLDATYTAPTIPLNRCPTCQKLGPQTLKRCPDDGQEMQPVWDLKYRALPHRGFGPRRAVCDSCGTTYSGAAKYCSIDGSQLTPLN